MKGASVSHWNLLNSISFLTTRMASNNLSSLLTASKALTSHLQRPDLPSVNLSLDQIEAQSRRLVAGQPGAPADSGRGCVPQALRVFKRFLLIFIPLVGTTSSRKLTLMHPRSQLRSRISIRPQPSPRFSHCRIRTSRATCGTPTNKT